VLSFNPVHHQAQDSTLRFKARVIERCADITTKLLDCRRQSGIPGQATYESSSEPALFSLEHSADTFSLIFLDEHPASALRLVSVSLA
jgi:hypothetical protein